MLLKFKNRYVMALDKMIKEAAETGGMIDRIILDPQEAYELLLELVRLGSKYITDLTIHDIDEEDVTREKLLWGNTEKHERIKEIVQLWYKTKYEVRFKGIKLVVVKPKVEKKPEEWLEPESKPLKPDEVIVGTGPIPRQTIKSKPLASYTERTVILDVPKPSPPGRLIKEGEQPPKPPAARSVTGKELPDVTPPLPPKMPPNRMLNEDECGIFGGRKLCDKCGSSLKTKWMLFNVGGCIQPECENYWERYRD